MKLIQKNLFKRYLYIFLNISIFSFNAYAEEIKPKKKYFFNQYLSQIIWEKVKENKSEKLMWEIYDNPNPVNFKKKFKENKKKVLEISDSNEIVSKWPKFLLKKGKKNIEYGYINDTSDFYTLKLGLSKRFNIDFTSELNNSKNNIINPNKFKSIYLEKGVRNFRGGGTLQIFSQSRGDIISTNFRLSYGEKVGSSKHGYIFSEVVNQYSKNDWLSFNLNPQFSYTRFGNISSLSSSLNWKLNPKFEIIPEANINLHNAENNFSLTGRTYLSKNIIMDNFVSNSFGVTDMARQFKSESIKYGVKLNLIF